MDAGSWSIVTPMPTPRSQIVAAAASGRIYVAGGLFAEGISDVLEYLDVAAGRWQRAFLPFPTHHIGMAASDGFLYIAGGYRDFDYRADQRGFWRFDARQDIAWERLPDMPAPRAAQAMVTVGARLYSIGGVGPDPTAIGVFDLATSRWIEDAPPLPAPREHAAAAVLGDRIYVAGGRWNRANLATLEVLDTGRRRWTRLRDMPNKRSDHAAAFIDGKLHVVGGDRLDGMHTVPGHDVYDPTTDSWAEAPALPTPRHGLAGAVMSGRWYTIGGATGTMLKTLDTLTAIVEVFEPAPAR